MPPERILVKRPWPRRAGISGGAFARRFSGRFRNGQSREVLGDAPIRGVAVTAAHAENVLPYALRSHHPRVHDSPAPRFHGKRYREQWLRNLMVST